MVEFTYIKVGLKFSNIVLLSDESLTTCFLVMPLYYKKLHNLAHKWQLVVAEINLYSVIEL